MKPFNPRFAHAFACFALFYAWLPGYALAAGAATPADQDATAQFMQLERDIPSLYLVNGLYLSEAQLKQWIPLLEDFRKTGALKSDKAKTTLQDSEKNAAAAVERELSRNGNASSFKASDIGPTAQLLKSRKDIRDLMDEREKETRAAAEKALALLTPAQRGTVEQFVPCFIPPNDFKNPERVGQASADSTLEKGLSRLREAPEAKLEHVKEKTLDQLVSHVMKENHRPFTEDEIRQIRQDTAKTLDDTVANIRAMNAADFELEKAKLASDLLCALNGQATKKAGETLHKVKSYLLNPGILDVLKQRAGLAAATPATDGAAAVMELKKRGEPLKAAGLLASLDVTPQQAGQLLPIVREAVKAREIVDTEARKVRASAIESYLRLRAELAQQQPAEKTEAEAQKLHHKVKMLFEDTLTQEFLKYQTQADRILSADQVAGLMNFQPGQNKRGKNPLVEKTRRRSAELLDRARAMKAYDFQQQKEALCRQFVLACAEDAAQDENTINTDAEIRRAAGVLEKARSLGSDAYVQSGRELTAELCPRRSEPRPALYGWQQREGEHLEVMEGVTPLLFSDAALDVLQKLVK